MTSQASRQQVEVELRAKIDRPLAERLIPAGQPVTRERDVYFRHSSDTEKRWIARIRRRGAESFLTFKSSAQFGEGAWDEVDLPISSDDATRMEAFLLANGFNVEVEIEKERVSFSLRGIHINVDNVKGLGAYVEAEVVTSPADVEGARRRILAMFEELGIPGDAVTRDGYVRLMRDAAS